MTVFSTKTHDRSEYRGMKLRRVRSIRLPGWERLGYSFVAAVVSMWGSFDLVHFHSYSSSGFCFLPKLARKKVAVTVHRLEWQDAKWRGPARAFLRFCERTAARWADVLITVSKNFEDDLRARYPRAKNIHYVPNGVTVPEGGDPDVCERLGLTPGRVRIGRGQARARKGLRRRDRGRRRAGRPRSRVRARDRRRRIARQRLSTGASGARRAIDDSGPTGRHPIPGIPRHALRVGRGASWRRRTTRANR